MLRECGRNARAIQQISTIDLCGSSEAMFTAIIQNNLNETNFSHAPDKTNCFCNTFLKRAINYNYTYKESVALLRKPIGEPFFCVI